MAWGAQVTKINGYDVTIQYSEDATGEIITETKTLPDAPEPSWIGDLTANRIVQLTRRTSAVLALAVGAVTPTQAIIDAAQVEVSTVVGKVVLGAPLA